MKSILIEVLSTLYAKKSNGNCNCLTMFFVPPKLILDNLHKIFIIGISIYFFSSGKKHLYSEFSCDSSISPTLFISSSISPYVSLTTTFLTVAAFTVVLRLKFSLRGLSFSHLLLFFLFLLFLNVAFVFRSHNLGFVLRTIGLWSNTGKCFFRKFNYLH